VIPEDSRLRHLLHGRKPNLYRVIYAIDDEREVVTVLHIRHGRRDAFVADGDAEYRSALALTGMRAGLVWRLRAKSMRYQPAVDRPESQSFGRLV
jgi:hypothetical protein